VTASTAPSRTAASGLDASPLRWVILAAGVVMCIYGWQTRQPHTSADFTIFYNASARPVAEMYARPPGPPRGNMNPPHFQLALEPLTYFTLPVAAAIFRVLSLVSLCACLWWLARESAEPWGAADVGALLAWSPMQSVINLNQLTWVLWPLLIVTWTCWRRGRWTAGAVAFGIALSFKSFLGLFLIWLALKGQWRALVVSLGVAAAALAIGIAAYGAGVFRAWLDALASVQWSYAVMNASWRGILARSFTVSGSAGAPIADSPAIVTPLFVVGAAAIVVVTFARTRRRTIDESWPALMAASLLVSPLGWVYYIWWMLPGIKPSRLLVAAPLLWVPMVGVLWGQPSPWATISIGSVFFWGLLLAWAYAIGNGIGRVRPLPAGEVMQRDADAPSVR
jgi:hypothetical protein